MIDHVTRRTFVAGSSLGAALVWLAPPSAASPWPRAPGSPEAASPNAGSALTAGELECLDAVTALILPSDEVPGAREAGVTTFIDRALGTWAAVQLPLFREGLRALDDAAARNTPDHRFARVEPGVQRALLRDVERTPFFQAVRFATLAGMFSAPVHGGNRGEVGWRLIGYEERHAWQPPFGFYDAFQGAHGG